MPTLVSTAVSAGSLVLGLAASTAHASIIVDVAGEGAAAVGPGIVLAGTGVPLNNVANDFTLAESQSLRAASFFTLESNITPWDGTLTYTILAADGGFDPTSTVVAQGAVTTYWAETLVDGPSTNLIRRIDFNFATPIDLDAGDYWFNLSATQAEGAGRLAWRTVQPTGISASTTNPNFTGWTLQQGEAAFQLRDRLVPGPGAGAVLMAGAPLLLRRRRQR